MLLSYWRSYSEAGRVIVCAALAATALAWVAVYGNYGPATHDRTEHENSEVSRLNSPRLYQPHCDVPESAEEADLCAQREMAEAARDLYDLTWLQFWVTLAGTGAVLASLKFTRDALAVARDAIRTEREMGEAQVRAYLAVEEIGIGFDDLRPVFKIRLRNAGNSPAMALHATGNLTIHPFDPPSLPDCDPVELLLGALSPGETTDDVHFEFDAPISRHRTFAGGKLAIRVVIYVRWMNAFKKMDALMASYAVWIERSPAGYAAMITPETMWIGEHSPGPQKRHG